MHLADNMKDSDEEDEAYADADDDQLHTTHTSQSSEPLQSDNPCAWHCLVCMYLPNIGGCSGPQVSALCMSFAGFNCAAQGKALCIWMST